MVHFVLPVVFAGLVGCGPAKSPTPKSVPLSTRSLVAITQGPGLRWALLANPRVLFEGPLSASLAEIIPKKGLEKLRERLGFDVTRTDQALVAGYAESTFYAVGLPKDTSPDRPLESFSHLSLPPNGKISPRADLVRIYGSTPRGGRASAAGMWSTEGDVFVAESGHFGPVNAAMALATGQLASTRSLAKVAPFAALLPFVAGAPFAMVARCPLTEVLARDEAKSLDPAAKNPVFAEECEGASLAVSADREHIVIHIRLTGHWGTDREHIGDEIRAMWARIVASDLGHVFGLREGAEAKITSGAEVIDAEMRVRAKPLAQGLHRLLAADVKDITK